MCSCFEWYRRDDGRNPVNVFICGERQSEEAARDEHSTNLAHDKAELGWRIAIHLGEAPVASTKGTSYVLTNKVANHWIDLLVPVWCRSEPDEETDINTEEC